MIDLTTLKWDTQGLIPVIVQDNITKEVLMLAYMNEEALAETIDTKKATYYSRSRQELWIKGETSGNTQEVVGLNYDCDADSLLLFVRQKGVACHTGKRSCFHNEIIKSEQESFILNALYEVIDNRKNNPKDGSYTTYLFKEGIDKILKKVGEETTEVVIATKNNDYAETVYEVSDLIYHLLVLLVNQEIALEDIYTELRSRQR